jgi:hypothetical protein
MPEITPVDGATVRPGGIEPELRVYVYGAVPPEAAGIAWE